ncbi:DUF418 domain-containing protein [Bacillus sp. 31A1R]|uniref:DUF418 domain-containing protein n=1 Tax=Robertmurraya mangrovi TaxID=3098077 RepID=A0ABU5ISZ5_9BACI|nr:DUF418 domain-containing protein [Bacillus sp. 31A1R]MDZ5470277.1 DUF418 domain-containing protein [Bacillus sp. 31A1R]
MEKLNSIQPQERIISMDIMRGFAIFGIFLVNMISFHSPFLYIDPLKWWDGTLNTVTYSFIDIFAQASFYPLFSMLFGYGLVILRERTLAKGINFVALSARRLTLLLGIGCIHAFLIWHGDILINYAIFGFILLLFLRLSGKAMMITGALLYIIPNILFGLLIVVSIMFAPEGELDLTDMQSANRSLETYQNGSFVDITEQRFEDWYSVNNLANFIIMFFNIFPLFLLGGGAAKLKWLENVRKYKKMFTIIVITTLILGLGIKVAPYLFEKNLALEFFQDFFGGSLLTIAYALGIALLTEVVSTRKVITIFAPVGKLAISNYLFQSIVSTTIFYSYGFRLYGQFSVFQGILLALFIFSIQVIISHIWIKYYLYGPVEWLWRSFTYMKWQKLKKSKA